MRIPDCDDLRGFHLSPLGRMVQSLLGKQITRLWDDECKNLTVAGYGYALPFLEPAAPAAAQSFNAIPRALGLARWQRPHGNATYIIPERGSALPHNCLDRIIMIHALEYCHRPEEVIAELWDVLKSNGRMILIVPSRMGLWARSERTPFGSGYPYSYGAVTRMLKDNAFIIERYETALFFPPIRKPLFLKAAPSCEMVGSMLAPALGGVHIIEVSKKLYAGTARARSAEKGFKAPAYRPAGAARSKI